MGDCDLGQRDGFGILRREGLGILEILGLGILDFWRSKIQNSQKTNIIVAAIATELNRFNFYELINRLFY